MHVPGLAFSDGTVMNSRGVTQQPSNEMLQPHGAASLGHLLRLHNQQHHLPTNAGNGYHNLQQQQQQGRRQAAATDVATNGPKSFTIAAILGLQQDEAAVMNLSLHRASVQAAAGAPRMLHAAHRHEHAMSKKSSSKSKRVRTIFTPEQLERLEAEFERQQYMVGPERLYLAHTLQLTEAQVKVWFQNRRIKWRKHHLEVTQQRLALIRQRQLGCPTARYDPETADNLSDSMDIGNSPEDT